MILDSRIKEGKRPLTCIDIEQAREFVGKKCLFSNSFVNYKNIKEYEKFSQYTGFLDVNDNFKYNCKEESPFINKNDGYCYDLVLPWEWVEKTNTTKFIPYTLDTWQYEFGPGDIVFFRGKKDTCKDGTLYKCMYLGYLEQDNRILVILGPWLFSFDELFKLYEINRIGRWEPFGRKVETIDLNVI